ncbi:hypothetical protein Tco_0553770 [Tanacetum coccineum]
MNFSKGPSRYFRVNADNTNVVNWLLKSHVVGNQDPVNFLTQRPSTNRTIVVKSAVDSLAGNFVRHCTCKLVGKLMEQMATLRDLVGQAIQKKEEKKRNCGRASAKRSILEVPICYDDDETTPLQSLRGMIILSSDDDSPYGENIDYVDASSPDVEIVSLEVVEIVDPEVGRIDDDILLTIKDDILREKLLNVNLLIAKIDSLRDNPTIHFPSCDKSTPHFLKSILGGD